MVCVLFGLIAQSFKLFTEKVDYYQKQRTMDKSIIESRRVFINKGEDYYQLFSFTQDKDGSIYCSMPEFPEIQWMQLLVKDNLIQMQIVVPLEDKGKLSFHGSGMVAYRAHKDPKGHQLIVHGHHLKEKNNTSVFGVRHLLSCFFQEPNFIPLQSPALNRKTDYLLKSSIELKPFVMLLFAVPGKPNLQVRIDASFHVDDIDIPPDVSFGNFDLRYHNIVWVIYRTKNMERWPTTTHAMYFDGFRVPMFIGQSQNNDAKKGECRLEIRSPSYRLQGDILQVQLPI
jgi:hypothetical protein